MAVYCITSSYLALSGTDYSAHVKSVTLALDAAVLDSTDMASGGWQENIAGLKSGTLTIDFQDDAADASIDNVLDGLFGTVVSFEVRPTSAAVGTGNPKRTGNVLINSLPVGGAVGDLAMKSVSYPTSGAVTRAEA